MTPTNPVAAAIEELEPFAKECARQERVTSYRDGDCRIIDCRLTVGHFRRLTAALASLRSLAHAPVDTTKYYWLIERRVNPPHYATSDSHMPGWTADPLRAYRYATKEDADDTARHLPDDIRKDAAVTQHGFMDRSLAHAKGESVDRELLKEAWGALNFILAFYDPNQRHLDANAWKQAEASGRRVHAKLRAAIDAPESPSPGQTPDLGREAVIEEKVREFERLLRDYGNGCVLCMSAHVHIVSTDFAAREKAVVDAYRSALSAAPGEAVGREGNPLADRLEELIRDKNMTGLQMKYFVLKPQGDDLYASASRAGMRAYANIIRQENPELSDELRQWADNEQLETPLAREPPAQHSPAKGE